MVGILSGSLSTQSLFGGSQTAVDRTRDSLKALADQRLQTELDKIDQDFTEKNDSVGFTSDRLINVKAQINNVNQAIDNGQEQLADIRTTLQNMFAPLENIANGEDRTANIEAFNAQVTSINTAADRYAEQYNLVGSTNPPDWDGNELEYAFDLTSARNTVKGTFAGVDFYIKDSGSDTLWRFDRGSDTLEEYSDFGGEKLDRVMSTRTGVRSMDSYDPETGAISMTVSFDGENTETINGTMQRAGLSTMQSWFYNDFAAADGSVDPAKLEDARSAIRAALEEVDLYSGKLSQLSNNVSMDERKTDALLAENSESKTDALATRIASEQVAQIKAAQEYQAITYNIDRLSAQQSAYRDVFLSFVRTKNNPLFFDSNQ